MGCVRRERMRGMGGGRWWLPRCRMPEATVSRTINERGAQRVHGDCGWRPCLSCLALLAGPAGLAGLWLGASARVTVETVQTSPPSAAGHLSTSYFDFIHPFAPSRPVTRYSLRQPLSQAFLLPRPLHACRTLRHAKFSRRLPLPVQNTSTAERDRARARPSTPQSKQTTKEACSRRPRSPSRPKSPNDALQELSFGLGAHEATTRTARLLKEAPESERLEVPTTMPRGSEKDDRAVYDKFASLLSPSTTSRHRSASEIADGMKRIRRLILTDGIPEIVSWS